MVRKLGAEGGYPIEKSLGVAEGYVAVLFCNNTLMESGGLGFDD